MRCLLVSLRSPFQPAVGCFNHLRAVVVLSSTAYKHELKHADGAQSAGRLNTGCMRARSESNLHVVLFCSVLMMMYCFVRQ